MNTLILSCSTGQGHNSCARAIEEYYRQTQDHCTVKDALALISQDLSSFLSWGHATMYRYIPSLFRWGYSFSEGHQSLFRQGGVAYRLLVKGCDALYQLILEGGYDSVICAHPFAAVMMTRILQDHPGLVVTANLATDYVCHPGIDQTRLDLYFAPDESLRSSFKSGSIALSQVIPSGIPVRQMFYGHPDHLRNDPSREMHLLMMCGSMGCGPIEELTDQITRIMGSNVQLSVVCGTNRPLYRRLTKAYAGEERVQILGYVKDMAGLMAKADLCLTKPGGISVTECAVMGLPMVLIDAVSGCEEYNRRFFTALGGARSGKSVKELAELSLELLGEPEVLSAMRQRLLRRNRENSALIIHDHMKEMVKEKHETA